MLKKLFVASSLMVFSTMTFAQAVQAEISAEQKICNDKGGIFFLGTCTDLAVSTEVSGLQMNSFRYKGGNEASLGDSVVQFDARISKNFAGRRIKTVYIDISAIPSEQVLNYLETLEQNQHNENRFRADGYADRPELLAHMGMEIDLTKNQELTLMAGSFEASGLEPLDGKTSRYYMTAPYALIVRYDKGMQMNYELKDKVEKIISASFSLIDGDGVKGESSVTPSDSRANSYTSFAGSFEVQIANALGKVFTDLKPFLKNQDFYMGVTGSTGETGSFKGEKRTQDDFTAYLGYMVKTKLGEGEVRVFKSSFNRNPIGDGSGGHVPLIASKGQGVELAWRGMDLKYCDMDLYGNAHSFESNGEDGEFTWGDVRSVQGWTAGVSCTNFRNIKNLNAGVEYGSVKTFDSNRKMLGDEKIISLVFRYKIGTPAKTNNRY